MRSARLFVFLLLAAAAVPARAQVWSGILSPGRAIDWSNVGARIPATSTICTTLGTAGQPPSFVQSVTAAQINTAITSAGCQGGTASNPKVVFLNAGTYNLNAGIVVNQINNLVVRGAGADQTLWVMSASGGCNGQGADFCIRTADNNWYGGADNSAAFSGSGPWPAATTQITLSSVTNLKVGSIMILDQIDDLTDTNSNWIYVCETSPTVRPGQSPNCNEDNSGTGGDSGAQRGSGGTSPRGQQQIVRVTAINGTTVTFTPGLYMPNWRASQSPGAWWDSNPVSGDGVENLSIQHATGNLNIILISNCSNCWVTGVRSVKPDRSHVSLWTDAHVTIRDSYLFQTANGVSQSYGVETFGASDVLQENNIFQQVAAPQMFNSDCEGCVAAYNFSINDLYTASTNWLQQSTNFHSSVQFVLLEGLVGSGLYSDRFHGTSHFATLFRNRLDGQEKNGTTSTTSHTNPLILYPLSRYMNVIGNVLGTAGYHNNYQDIANNSPSPDTSIYLIGTGASFVVDDLKTGSTLMRWGNYDAVTLGIRWCGSPLNTGWLNTCGSISEVPIGLSNFANPVPTLGDVGAGQSAMPASFYRSSMPSWWPSTKPWPPIGPDVTGGNIPSVGGHAYTIPAEDCYLNTMGGPSDGTGNVLSFNAGNCYGSIGSSSVAPPTNLQVVVQ